MTEVAVQPVTPQGGATHEPDRVCPLCSRPADAGSRRGRVLAECGGCGVLYRAVSSGKDETGYWSSYTENSIEQTYDAHRAVYYKMFWRMVSRLPRKGVGQPSVLDVGCVPGMVLREAKADGWDAQGVEISEELCEATRKFCGARMWNGFLENIDFGSQKFDLVTISDVFRAMSNPLDALRKCREVLKPGGALLVREIDWRHRKHAERVEKPYRYDMQFLDAPTARRFAKDAGFSRCELLNSPMSLLTVRGVYKLAKERPALYRAVLTGINTTAALTNPIGKLRGRPLTSSFLLVAYP